jgi:prepilin-type N-terminal cleavage/methylation domain-containing protein
MRPQTERGFTLIEVLVAAGLLASLAAGGAYLVARAIDDAEGTRRRLAATVAGVQKMEQLRSLAWGDDIDWVSRLDQDPPSADGVGLGWSPAGTLDADVHGYVDFLDGDGLRLPDRHGAVFARRWAVAPHATAAGTLVLEVVVTRASGPSRRTASVRPASDIQFTSLRARYQP